MDPLDLNPEVELRDKGGTIVNLVDHKQRAKSLHDALAIEAWIKKSIAPPESLLGDLVTRTSRTFLIGSTGLGKTMFGLALACGMASGTGFLHWRSQRAARVLYVDGEMPAELIKMRCIDALRRNTGNIPAGNLSIYARDLEEEFAVRFPMVGRDEPLNTEGGRNFMLSLIKELSVDVVIFDNVMSLIAGDQKDELAWSDTMPLVETLTRQHVGQVWLDHTGHNSSRQYGSSTKAWRFDSVGIMEALSDGDRIGDDLAFTLSFDNPGGKARRRTPTNRADFDRCTIRLDADRWVSDASPTQKRSTKKLPPMMQSFLDALQAAERCCANPAALTRDAWEAEAIRQGLVQPADPNEGSYDRGRRQAGFRKYIADLKAAGLISVDGHAVQVIKK